MAVLTSNIISMVVEKRNASSFRDVEIAVVPQVYCACIGLGGGGGHGRRWCTFSGRILKMGMAGFLRWVW